MESKERVTADSIFPRDAELRASDVKITEHGCLRLVMKDKVNACYTPHSTDQ